MPATRTKRTNRKAPAPTASEGKAKKIPRPSNSFMIYRSDCSSNLKIIRPALFPIKQGPLSKIIAELWAEEPDDIREAYADEAAQKLEEHKAMYPGYSYHPTTKAQKEAKKKEAEAKKARADEEKAAKAASRMASARASRTRATPLEDNAPVPGPSQTAAPCRKSRTSAPSTSTAGGSGPRTRSAAALPGMGVFPLVDSHVDSRLSSATPSLEYDGETLRSLPFPLQPTATAFVSASAPENIQHTAPGFSPPVDAYYSVPQAVQGWSAQAPGRDLLSGFTMASPALSNASDPLGLSREWYGLPPREIDASFPSHLPIAGLMGPIDLEDAVFALNNAQMSGVAWMVPPPFMNINTPNLSAAHSPFSLCDESSANENDTLAPTIDAAEVYNSIDVSAVNAAAGNLDVLTYTEPAVYAASPECEPVFTEPQQCIWGDAVCPQVFQDTAGDFDEIDTGLLATIGVSVGPSL